MEQMIGVFVAIGITAGSGLIAWGTLRSKVDNHCQNNDVHSTYEKNSQLFVPREENKITVLANKERFDSLDKNIDEIKCDVKKLLSMSKG